MGYRIRGWSGQPLGLEEVVQFLMGEVADYKLPEMVEHFEELPMTERAR